MTSEEKTAVRRLRSSGYGYKRIASAVGLPQSTVKSFLRRNPLPCPENADSGGETAAAPGGAALCQNNSAESEKPGGKSGQMEGAEPQNRASDVLRPASQLCLSCGAPLVQLPGRRQKKFCSDTCRTRWWNRNKYKIPRKTIHTFRCGSCGGEFLAYGTTKRKYCSHQCYITGRFYSKTHQEENRGGNEE
jgi:hypothetical protein